MTFASPFPRVSLSSDPDAKRASAVSVNSVSSDIKAAKASNSPRKNGLWDWVKARKRRSLDPTALGDVSLSNSDETLVANISTSSLPNSTRSSNPVGSLVRKLGKNLFRKDRVDEVFSKAVDIGPFQIEKSPLRICREDAFLTPIVTQESYEESLIAKWTRDDELGFQVGVDIDGILSKLIDELGPILQDEQPKPIEHPLARHPSSFETTDVVAEIMQIVNKKHKTRSESKSRASSIHVRSRQPSIAHSVSSSISKLFGLAADKAPTVHKHAIDKTIVEEETEMAIL